MRKSSRLFGAVALFALTLACAWYMQRPAVAQEKQKPNDNAPAVTKWEYRIVVLRDRIGGFGGLGGDAKAARGEKEAEDELNKLGEEGFEIVAVTAAGQSTPLNFGGKGPGDGPGRPLASVVYYTLKRAKK